MDKTVNFFSFLSFRVSGRVRDEESHGKNALPEGIPRYARNDIDITNTLLYIGRKSDCT